MARLPIAVAVAASIAVVVLAVLLVTRKHETAIVVKQPCGDRIYGQIASLTRTGGAWRLRFDPAWLTTGLTANIAAAQDGVIDPGDAVPNDYYVVDDGQRRLTYWVAPGARATVLTNPGTGITHTTVTVADLAQLVATGRSPAARLIEPLASGIWLRVHGDTVCRLDQQYLP